MPRTRALPLPLFGTVTLTAGVFVVLVEDVLGVDWLILGVLIDALLVALGVCVVLRLPLLPGLLLSPEGADLALLSG